MKKNLEFFAKSNSSILSMTNRELSVFSINKLKMCKFHPNWHNFTPFNELERIWNVFLKFLIPNNPSCWHFVTKLKDLKIPIIRWRSNASTPLST